MSFGFKFICIADKKKYEWRVGDTRAKTQTEAIYDPDLQHASPRSPSLCVFSLR